MTLAPVRTVAPTLAMWTVEQIKSHVREDGSDNDERLEALRDAVTDHLDGWTGILGRCLLPQTWRQDFAGFGSCDRIRLPLMPVRSITSVTYRDGSNALQTLAPAVYAGPFTDGLGAYVGLNFGQVWPGTYGRDDAVSITFVAGYEAIADVPKSIRHAALLMIGDLYENRESVVNGTISSKIQLSATVEALLAPHRRITP